jgi:hypothetical protein
MNRSESGPFLGALSAGQDVMLRRMPRILPHERILTKHLKAGLLDFGPIRRRYHLETPINFKSNSQLEKPSASFYSDTPNLKPS